MCSCHLSPFFVHCYTSENFFLIFADFFCPSLSVPHVPFPSTQVDCSLPPRTLPFPSKAGLLVPHPVLLLQPMPTLQDHQTVGYLASKKVQYPADLVGAACVVPVRSRYLLGYMRSFWQ